MSSLLDPCNLTFEHKIGTFTAAEIPNQPATWRKVWQKIQAESKPITSFLTRLHDITDLNIILTGAGSSAFIGDTVLAAWLCRLSAPTQAIPTTDLVTHFKERVELTKPLLLISFARSGNSPESTATVQRADALCDNVYHLIITCNADGQLARMEKRENTYVFLLPPEAEDQSLAMTNSFTSMALAATLIPKLGIDEAKITSQIDMLYSYGQRILDTYTPMLYQIAQSDFNRIVFLGSGRLWGIAKESHLKVQELTNGRIVGKFDSFLGFRHGPKAIINDETLLVYLLSNNKETNRYEKDLIEQVAQHDINLTTLGIAETNCLSTKLDYCLNLDGKQTLGEEYWSIFCALPAQIIGFYKSLILGFDPDNPSTNGTISRVVEGVTIYNEGLKKENTRAK